MKTNYKTDHPTRTGLMAWMFYILSFLAVGLSSAGAITIDFSAAKGYTTGSLLEGQPAGGTAWLRTGSNGNVNAAFQVTSGTAYNSITSLVSNTSTITNSGYYLAVSGSDIGGTFNSASSVLNYSFMWTLAATNTTATIVSRFATGNLGVMEIELNTAGKCYISNSNSGVWAATTPGGSTYFYASAGVPFTVAGQINYATRNYTISVNNVPQMVSGTGGTLNFGFVSTSATSDLINIQNQSAYSAAWEPVSISNIQYGLASSSSITSSLMATGTAGVAFNYNITANNSPASYGASGLPSGLSVNTSTGAITGTATATGTSSVAISAINATGTASATLVLTMLPPPPVITSSLTATGTEGVAFTYNISASNSPTSYDAIGLPSGLSVDPIAGTISGTATASGTSFVTITAISASGTTTATLIVTILPVGYNLTVRAGGLRQTYQGFGAAQGEGWLTVSDSTQRKNMAELVFNELNCNAVRFDVHMVSASSPSNSNQFRLPSDLIANFNSQFVAIPTGTGTNTVNMFKEIQTQAPRVKNILIMADTLGAKTPGSGAVYTTGSAISMSQYAAGLAQLIAVIRADYPTAPIYTGVINEPTTVFVNWSNQDILTCVQDLTADLSGSNGVLSGPVSNAYILAPEFGNTLIPGNSSMTTLMADPIASNSLCALGTHDYGYGYTDDQELIADGLPLWVTESSDAGLNEPVEDGPLAADVVAHYLGDVNNWTNQWFAWIGINAEYVAQKKDTSTALITYDLTSNTMFGPCLQYYYFQQILSGSFGAIEPNAVVRLCHSDTEGDLAYTKNGTGSDAAGIYPAMNATAALNPDGSWGVCLLNDATGYDANHYAATDYNVTVTVEELANVNNLNFTVYTSGPNMHVVNSGTVTMVNGVVTVPVLSSQCVCLKSGTAALVAPPTPTGLRAFALDGQSGPQVTLDWNMGGQATGWVLARSTTSGTGYNVIASGTTLTTTSFTDAGVSHGTTYYYIVSATNSKGSSPYGAAIAATPQVSPWTDANLGTTSGSAIWTNDGIYTVSGDGNKNCIVAGGTDTCNFMSMSTSASSQTIVARLVRNYVWGSSGNYLTYGGVAMRASGTDPSAPDVSLTFHSDYLRQTTQVMMYSRTAENGNTVLNGTANVTVPANFADADPLQWLKLVRVGSQFTGYYSTDGSNWNPVLSGTNPATATVSMSGTIATGLISSEAYATGTLSNAVFDNVQVTQQPPFPQWAAQFFSPLQMTQSNVSGPTATPENDSIPNLLKYLFDINPSRAMNATDRAALPVGGETSLGGTNYLTLAYRQNPQINGITVNLQTSSDLRAWQTVTPALVQTVGTDWTTGDPIIQLGVGASGSREFIRLNVTSP